MATILSSEANAVADALSSYDPGDTSELRLFQPTRWDYDAMREHMDSIYEFYSRNVTRIYGRSSLHALVDLVYHSTLSVTLDEKTEKGWLELLIVGDSSQGKTEVTKNLAEWYGLGVRVDCKNATVAGLLGGLEQMNGKWFAQWGVIPVHDRRLVILEELKGLHPEVFAKLTDTRSSGKAQIPKIHRSTTWARTRLIAVSNPAKRGVTMDAYAFGVNAAMELVPNPEDLRRFDAVMILNRGDIDTSLLNRRQPAAEELFDAELAKRLVLWGWTREAKQVHADDDAVTLIHDISESLNDTYSDSIPIFDRGSTRNKLLRWATAAAVRTFSTDASGLEVIVRPCHVQYIEHLLRQEYQSRSSGYLEYSRSATDENTVMHVADVLKAMNQMGGSLRFAAQRLVNLHDLDAQDFSDVSGFGFEESRSFVGKLVRAGALKRTGRIYNKTPKFVAWLRDAADGKFDEPMPAHLEADTNAY
jgi:hypothetical protein